MKERLAQSVARIGRMVMFRSAILVLSFARLSLVEGAGVSSKPPSAKNVTEIEANSERRILYGTEAEEKDFPYLVQVRRSSLNTLCGGAIIANHWILTAGHCMIGEPCTGIRIAPAATSRRPEFRPTQCIRHPKQKIERYEYDIGLIKVKEDLLQDRRIKKIKLPPPGKIYPPGKPFVISGWGLTEDKTFHPTLLSASVPLITWEKCNKQFHEHLSPEPPDLPIRMLCLQSDAAGPTSSGICLGDSGGPAATFDGVIVGVASFTLETDRFCKIGGPSMFSSVVDYLPWIYSHIEPKRDTSSYPVRPEHDVP